MSNNKFHYPQRAPPPEKNIPRVKRWGEVGLARSRQKIKIHPPLLCLEASAPALYCSSPNTKPRDSRTPRRLSSYRAKKDYSATGLYLRSNMKRTEPSK